MRFLFYNHDILIYLLNLHYYISPHPLVFLFSSVPILRDIYSITNEQLIGDFHILCKNLHRFVNEHKHECAIKLYLEQPKQNNCYSIIDTEDNRVVLIHHSETKRVPERT